MLVFLITYDDTLFPYLNNKKVKIFSIADSSIQTIATASATNE